MKVAKLHCLLAVLTVSIAGLAVNTYFLKMPSIVPKAAPVLTSRNRSDNQIPLQHSNKDSLIHKVNLENGTVTHLNIKDHSRNILLYTALLSNSSNVSSWDRLAITGWEDRDLFNHKSVCCVRFQSGLVRRYDVNTKVKRYKVKMEARQYICHLNGTNRDDVALESTIVPDNSTVNCPLERLDYLEIEHVYRHPGEIAIFTKIIYDNPSAVDLMAWFEIHSLMGLSKAVFYTFRLSENATTVLNYYSKKGIAELIPFEFPDSKYYGNDLQRHVHGTEHFNHEDVAMMDAQERLRGYKYVLAIDIDEYVVPHHNETWMTLFDRLCAGHPDAAGFIFGTYIFTTSWGATSNTSQYAVGKFLNRTRLLSDCVKHFSIPFRLETGGMQPHSIVPKRGFRRYRVPENEAAVRHYRPCRKSYHFTKEKCFELKRVTDDFLYKVLKPIEKEVLGMKASLGF